MLILGIDSSTTKLSVALNDGNKIIKNIAYSKDREFIKVIIPLVEVLLKRSNTELEAIDLFAVNTGPGDFTGTRIGISVAKTFALAENKPVFGVQCLDVLSAGIASQNSLEISRLLTKNFRVFILPVLDVKRSEVFFSCYRASVSEDKNTVAEIFSGGISFFVNKDSSERLMEYADLLQYFKDSLARETTTGTCREEDDGFSDTLDINSVLFTGGTAFLAYQDLKKLLVKVFGRQINLSKKNIFPAAGYLNTCAYWKAGLQQKMDTGPGSISDDQPIAPLYVRDFTPFVKK